MSLRSAISNEYDRVTATPHAKAKIVEAGRTQDINWTLGGREIAHKMIIFARLDLTKPVRIEYWVDPKFLRRKTNAERRIRKKERPRKKQ